MPSAETILVGNRAAALANDLASAIVDTVVRNAASISDYPKRQAELTNVDARVLFYLAAGTCFFAAKGLQGWGQDTTAKVINELSSELAQRFNYQRPPGSKGSEADLRAEIRENLTTVFASVPANFAHMITLMSGEDQEVAQESIFIWFLHQLSEVYPPALTLVSNGEIGLLSQIVSAFSTTLLAATGAAE